MNGYSLFASVVWAVVATYTVRAAARAVGEYHRILWVEVHARLYDEDAPVHEQPDRAPLSRASIEVPDDLHALAMQESESWAQDDTRAAIKEKFIELHAGGTASETWQRVRRSMGVGELP